MSTLRVLAVGVSVIIVGAIPGFLPGSLAPRIGGDLQFGSLELGIVVAAFYAVSAAASGPAGSLVERIGASAGMRLTCVAGAATMFAGAADRRPGDDRWPQGGRQCPGDARIRGPGRDRPQGALARARLWHGAGRRFLGG